MEPVIVSSILGALLPVASDAIGSIVQRLTGGAGGLSKNVDDVVKLKSADMEFLKAMAELDKPAPNVSVWVADLRGSFRPIIAITAFIGGIITLFDPGIPEHVSDNIFQLATMTTTYLFGERFMMGIKGYGKNK